MKTMLIFTVCALVSVLCRAGEIGWVDFTCGMAVGALVMYWTVYFKTRGRE